MKKQKLSIVLPLSDADMKKIQNTFATVVDGPISSGALDAPCKVEIRCEGSKTPISCELKEGEQGKCRLLYAGANGNEGVVGAMCGTKKIECPTGSGSGV